MSRKSENKKLCGMIVSVVGCLFVASVAHATTFETTLCRLYLNTSGGTGRTLDDDFSEDYYGVLPSGVDTIIIKNAFSPPVPEPITPFYWFHSGGVENTSLPGAGLRVTVAENEEVCVMMPGRNQGGLPGLMGDNGVADFCAYFANPVNSPQFGSNRWAVAYANFTRTDLSDLVGVNFNFNTGWYEGQYYEQFVRIRWKRRKDWIVYETQPLFVALDSPSDIVGIRVVVTSTGQAKGFYNINEGSWNSLGTVSLNWWPENYSSVEYAVAVLQGISEPVTIKATVDIDPDTLNLKSKVRWITCYIELPEGYNVGDIDVSTVMLNGQIQAESHPTEIGDYDDDGIADLMVKFDRSAVQELLEVGDEVEITVTGELNDETPFESSDTVRVIDEGGKK